MDINAGQLKEVVVFKNNTAKAAAGAGFTSGYTSVLPAVRGMLKQVTGSLGSFGGNDIITNSWQLFVRYQPALDTLLKVETIATINGVDYKVTNYELVNQRKEYYKIHLTKTTK